MLIKVNVALKLNVELLKLNVKPMMNVKLVQPSFFRGNDTTVAKIVADFNILAKSQRNE